MRGREGVSSKTGLVKPLGRTVLDAKQADFNVKNINSSEIGFGKQERGFTDGIALDSVSI